MTKVLYYLPVDEKYIEQWEYYKVDKEMLNNNYDQVIICSNFFSFLKNIFIVDHVYAWWWHRSVIIITISRLLQKKVFVTGAIHLNDFKQKNFYVKKNIIYKIAITLSLKFSSKSLFISNHQFKEISNHFKFKNLFVLRSSLNEHSSSQLEKKIKDKKIYIEKQPYKKKLIYCTIIWHLKSQYIRKGLFETINAFERLFLENPNNKFQYIIAGKDGPDINYLKEYINNLKSKNFISIRLNISNKEKEELLFYSDYYVQPSHYEGFGNAVLEAMSNACIPIVSNKTSQPEVVGKSGIIVKKISIDEIHNTLKYTYSINKKKYFNFLEECKNHINKNFTFDIRCKNFQKVTFK